MVQEAGTKKIKYANVLKIQESKQELVSSESRKMYGS